MAHLPPVTKNLENKPLKIGVDVKGRKYWKNDHI
jgi:hypothetical protein